MAGHGRVSERVGAPFLADVRRPTIATEIREGVAIRHLEVAPLDALVDIARLAPPVLTVGRVGGAADEPDRAPRMN